MSHTPINSEDIRSIGTIGNYYGGLSVLCNNGKYYWIIENYSTDLEDISEWEEISQELYIQLLEHDEGSK